MDQYKLDVVISTLKVFASKDEAKPDGMAQRAGRACPHYVEGLCIYNAN